MAAPKNVTPRYLFDKATYVRFLDRKDFRIAKYNDISLEGFSCICNKPMNIGDILRVEINLKMVSGGMIDDIDPHIARAEMTDIEKTEDQTVYHFRFVEFAENCFDNLTKAIEYLDKKENLVALPDMSIDNIHARQTISDIVSYIADHIQSGQIPLPVLPEIVDNINDIIQDPHAGIEKLSALIETDAIISAKILSIANSAFYQTASHINSISEAIIRLGTSEIQTLVLTIANKSLYHTKDKLFKLLLEKLWQYSLATACNAAGIATRLKLSPAEKYFTIGLVHNIGQTLLLRIIGEMAGNINRFSTEDIISTTGHHSPVLTALLLEHWNFSEEFIKAATHYKSPRLDQDSDPIVLIIHAASFMSQSTGYGLSAEKENSQECKAAAFLELSPHIINEIATATRLKMKKSINSFN